jgi:hypothetical protein
VATKEIQVISVYSRAIRVQRGIPVPEAELTKCLGNYDMQKLSELLRCRYRMFRRFGLDLTIPAYFMQLSRLLSMHSALRSQTTTNDRSLYQQKQRRKEGVPESSVAVTAALAKRGGKRGIDVDSTDDHASSRTRMTPFPQARVIICAQTPVDPCA